MSDVWVYYYRHMAPLAESFDDLYSAMMRAEYIEDDSVGSVEAVVDADGTEYNGYLAVVDWLKDYRATHPRPERKEEDTEPPEYREFRGVRWLV